MVSNSYSDLFKMIYEQGKFWFTVSTVIWGAKKGFDWVKDIREKDIPEVKTSINNVHLELQQQTSQIVTSLDKLGSEFKEMRQDFRTYVAPPMRMYAAKAAKTKKAKAQN